MLNTSTVFFLSERSLESSGSLRFAAEMRAGAANVKSGSKGTGTWDLEYCIVEVLYSAHLAGISYGPCGPRAEWHSNTGRRKIWIGS